MTSKYANLMKAFLKNQIPHEYKLFKEELLVYHEQKKNLFVFLFELYEFKLLGFNNFLCFYICVLLLFNFLLNIQILFCLSKI